MTIMDLAARYLAVKRDPDATDAEIAAGRDALNAACDLADGMAATEEEAIESMRARGIDVGEDA